MNFPARLLMSFLYFVSALYLLGLGVYMGLAVRDGSVRMISDFWMPYELALVVGLAAFQGALFAGEIRGIFRR